MPNARRYNILVRLLATLVAITLAAAATANGAMGLGLEMWDVRYWFAYVIVMVLAEAWLIGRWLGHSWLKAIGISVAANAITGVGCGLGGCPFLHFQSYPNPFLYSLGLMALFALPSAGVEAILWNRFAVEKRGNPIVIRSFWVHLVLVPIGLAILLIPARPYVGAEALTNVWRNYPRSGVKPALRAYISDKGALPMATNPTELQNELAPYDTRKHDFGVLLSTPVFNRFTQSSIPWEINPALRGRKIPPDAQGELWTWYARPRNPKSYERQIAVDVYSGNVDFTYDPARLKDLPR